MRRCRWGWSPWSGSQWGPGGRRRRCLLGGDTRARRPPTERRTAPAGEATPCTLRSGPGARRRGGPDASRSSRNRWVKPYPVDGHGRPTPCSTFHKPAPTSSRSPPARQPCSPHPSAQANGRARITDGTPASIDDAPLPNRRFRTRGGERGRGRPRREGANNYSAINSLQPTKNQLDRPSHSTYLCLPRSKQVELIDVHEGTRFRIQFAVSGRRPCPHETYTTLDTATRANILHTMRVLGDQGYVPNEERFKQIEGSDLHAIKKHRHRFVGFFLPDRRFVVASYEDKRTKGKLRDQTLDRAREIRIDLLDAIDKETRRANRHLAGKGARGS